MQGSWEKPHAEPATQQSATTRTVYTLVMELCNTATGRWRKGESDGRLNFTTAKSYPHYSGTVSPRESPAGDQLKEETARKLLLCGLSVRTSATAQPHTNRGGTTAERRPHSGSHLAQRAAMGTAATLGAR